MENYAEKKINSIFLACYLEYIFMIIFYEKKSIFFLALLCHFPALFNLYIHLVCVEKILIFSPHAHTKCLSLQTKNPCAIACAFSLYTLSLSISLSLLQGQKKIFLLALSLSPLDDFY
jgi:hypothetical protein